MSIGDLWQEDFYEGVCKGLSRVDNDASVLKLKEDANTGYFESREINVNPFNRLILSWNGKTPSTSFFKFQIQIKIEEEWTKWLTIAEWGLEKIKRSFPASLAKETGEEIQDGSVKVNIDTIVIEKPFQAGIYRFRVIFKRGDDGSSPLLKGIYVKTYDSEKGKVYIEALNSIPEKELKVPPKSQMVEGEDIARRICSPTSLAMVLSYFGIELKPGEIAEKVYDQGADIYGNWILNTAFAGSKGLTSYVDFFELSDLVREIRKNRPVICSVSFDSGELTGAPIESTPGHLLVVTGFTIKDHQVYIIANDPAAPDVKSVRRQYILEEFIKAWKGFVYVIKPEDN